MPSKGEIRRREILNAIEELAAEAEAPSISEVQSLTGIRSFDALCRHLKILNDEGFVEWKIGQPSVKLQRNREL